LVGYDRGVGGAPSGGLFVGDEVVGGDVD
jgi:hypothetical protein